eukprot:3748221-Pyramimonas_sp.AAC.1
MTAASTMKTAGAAAVAAAGGNCVPVIGFRPQSVNKPARKNQASPWSQKELIKGPSRTVFKMSWSNTLRACSA